MPDRPTKHDGDDSGFSNAQTQIEDHAPARISGEDLSPSEDEIRNELRRIVESREFQKSGRSQQFLHHVVACALRGDVRRLKESVIGLEVFGRVPGYDTGGDSTVRVRANDVRRRLLAYYQRVGNRARVRIELPPGSYAPKFCRVQSVPAPPASGVAARQRLVACRFPPLEDARLRQLHDLSATLRADAGSEFTLGTRDASPKTGCTPGSPRLSAPDGSGTPAYQRLYSLLIPLVQAMNGDCGYIGTVTTGDVPAVKTIAVEIGRAHV
jgi:hypothetical protein